MIRDAFGRLPSVRRIAEGVRPGTQRQAGGLWGASQGLLLATLAHSLRRPLIVVVADEGELNELEGDLRTFDAPPLLTLPDAEVDVEGRPDADRLGQRIRVLRALAGNPRFVLLATLRGLAQPAPSLRSLGKGHLALKRGDRLRQDELLQRAQKAGLRRVPVVLAPGEISMRGDVIDVFAVGADEALRIEFQDDVVDSLRTFDPGTQLSRQVVEAADVVLGQGADDGQVDTFTHALRPDVVVVRREPLRLAERAQQLTVFAGDAAAGLQRWLATTATLTMLDVGALPSHDLDLKVLSAGSSVGSGEADPLGRLRAIRGVAGRAHVVCRTEDEERRLREIFAHKQVDLAQERVTTSVGALSRGFRLPELDLTIVNNTEFAGVPPAPRVSRERVVPSKAIASFFELGPGDVVVHAAHGIARFEGIELVERGDAAEDHLRLLFADDVRLLVPASKIHLVQKYVGAGDATPKLDRLGGRGFQRRKEEVAAALFDMASDLLEVEAQRQKIRRAPYPPDPLEEQFVDAFPFTDTPDQQTAWREMRADLEREQPMDRLLCGDVGFGKTELAMRAAFKVAITGRQVAVLAPTTVLAEQHAQTFAARFLPFGLRVDVLSRFKAGAQRRALTRDLARGAIDVLIGTHAILGSDVEWRALGLVIVDEEQRFGVRHKEQLKKLRNDVDVLTLSATPIPRTLHASLLGLRAISTLATPPAGRQAVDTRLVQNEPRVLQEAIAHELGRGGQAFVLHNRISELPRLAADIERLVPRARVTIGHGQMTQPQMEKAIRGFVRGDYDVLVCTSIVENGLDIPRANTILIDRPELFGLAELHQLRGRVGRSAVRAHCLLLVDPTLPQGDEGRRRLKALEEFTQLGAGFAIAMRDLEIRGAGNLLGPQQSGHIAAVGYDTYVQLLRQAVESARTQRPVAVRVDEVDVDLRLQAFVPPTLVVEPKARLELLRELDGAVDEAARGAIETALRDRFGKLPAPLVRLLDVFLVKHLLLAHDVLGVQFVPPDRLIVRHAAGVPPGGAWLDAFAELRHVEAGKTHLMLGKAPQSGWTGDLVLARLRDALLGRAQRTRIAPWPVSQSKPKRR